MSQDYQYTPIPYTQLSAEALQGVIETFINREGTDYGLEEYSFEQKIQQVRAQIESGEAVIVFDHDSQSVGILHKDQLS
ncbi:MAG: YheU family protein [Gammaproteobacteria bacterium]|nr:YheU family protein [Gammaproteobacteria bacterium]